MLTIARANRSGTPYPAIAVTRYAVDMGMNKDEAARMLRKKRQGRWYDAGVDFRCVAPECNHCCTGKLGPGYVWVSADDMQAIAGHLDMPFETFTRKYIRQVDWSFSLIEKPNNDCVFLDEGGCSIYEVRPTQCRTYPFWPEVMRAPQTWRQEARKCPGIDQPDAHIAPDEIDRQLDVDRDARRRNNVGQ